MTAGPAAESAPRSPRTILRGRPGAPGTGVGRLLHPVPSASVPPSPVVTGEGSDRDEATRLLAALEEAALELEELARATTERAGPDIGAIFEAQALFARDPGLVQPALAAIAAGSPAAEAIDRVAAAHADQLAGIDDDYFRERAADVRDVARRVVAALTGRPRDAHHHADGTPAILAAEDLDPSVVAALRPGLVAGIALAGGAPNGHTAIVARALGVPLVLGLGAPVVAAASGVETLVDGSRGIVIVEPSAEDVWTAQASAPSDTAASPRPVVRSGLAAWMRVEANVGSVREAEEAAGAGADGIGLVRTELLFFGRTVPPGLEEQRAIYRRIAETFPSAPVVFRTLDIGGDKPASWSTATAEMNPALGVRGIRLGLRQPELLRTQLRALLEATAGRTLDLLLPMVSTLDEVAEARQVLAAARSAALAAGASLAERVRLGVMVEVPAVALLAEAFALEVDFLSVGTNDLTQYTLAADRTHALLADLATGLQPAVVRLIGGVASAAAEHGRPVTVCGELAADPAAGPLLGGLGVGALSVAPASVASVRDALGHVDPDAARAAATASLTARTLDEVRSILTGLVGEG